LLDDGSLYLQGVLDPEGGAALRSALEPLARKRGTGDERLQPKRMADALVELAMLQLDRGRLPRMGGQRPHLMVTTSLDTLLGLPGAPAAELVGAGFIPPVVR
jgi:hypothetical protein